MIHKIEIEKAQKFVRDLLRYIGRKTAEHNSTTILFGCYAAVVAAEDQYLTDGHTEDQMQQLRDFIDKQRSLYEQQRGKQ